MQHMPKIDHVNATYATNVGVDGMGLIPNKLEELFLARHLGDIFSLGRFGHIGTFEHIVHAIDAALLLV